MNKVQDATSAQVNQKYDLLSLQKKVLQETLGTSLGEKDLKKQQKKLHALEKELLKTKNLCRRNLLKNIKIGANIVGSLEHHMLLNEEKLKSSWAKWARKRGYSFEKLFCENLNQYATEHKCSAYAYRNYTSKFGFQPFDLAIFLRGQSPLLIECKASGILDNSKGLKLQACKRRYINYTESAAKNRLLDFLDRSGSLLLFAFRQEKTKLIYLVDARYIFENALILCSKQLDLDADRYYAIDFCPNTWPPSLFEELKAHFMNKSSESRLESTPMQAFGANDLDPAL